MGRGPHCPMVSGRSRLDKAKLAKQNTIAVNLEAGFDKAAFVRAILPMVASRDSSHRSLRWQGRLGHGVWLARRLFGPAEGPLQDHF